MRQNGILHSVWIKVAFGLVIVALLGWNIWPILPRPQQTATISYTAFINHVRSGDVSRVQISGSEITGEFVHPVVLPATVLIASGLPYPQVVSQPRPFSTFNTTLPQAPEDPTLLPLLESKGVDVVIESIAAPWLSSLLMDVFLVLLLAGFFVWFARRLSHQQPGMFTLERSKSHRYVGDHPAATFRDVAGASEAKQDLQEVVGFLRNPQKYHRIGARIPRGVLLVGPPGTGKTLMARAVAGEAAVPFFHISASEFVEMFVGVGASRVRDLFTQAKTAAPAIVFIDELDAVGRRRGTGLGSTNDEREQTLDQLLAEMDGFDERQEVVVLAATNRPDVLDPALLRPGRFDRRITVPLPDRRDREQVLRIHTRSMHLGQDVDIAVLARTTTGLSGADLANLCNEAALAAARHDHDAIVSVDFEEALDKVLLGGVRSLLLDENARRIVAYHEAGHALVAWLTSAADPVHKVTIIPRGPALGVTAQLPEDDRYNYSKSFLMARLDVMLGGRTAEELAIGDVTTGAENDLVEATRLARRMVACWGMGSLGLTAFQSDVDHPFLGYELAQRRDYSEATAARVDQDVQRLLDERHTSVCRLMSDARDKLDRLVTALLREDTVGQDELEHILGPRPVAVLVLPVGDVSHAAP